MRVKKKIGNVFHILNEKPGYFSYFRNQIDSLFFQRWDTHMCFITKQDPHGLWLTAVLYYFFFFFRIRPPSEWVPNQRSHIDHANQQSMSIVRFLICTVSRICSIRDILDGKYVCIFEIFKDFLLFFFYQTRVRVSYFIYIFFVHVWRAPPRLGPLDRCSTFKCIQKKKKLM